MVAEVLVLVQKIEKYLKPGEFWGMKQNKNAPVRGKIFGARITSCRPGR